MKETKNVSSQYIDQLLALKYMRQGGMFFLRAFRTRDQAIRFFVITGLFS